MKLKKKDLVKKLNLLWANSTFNTSTVIEYLEKEGIEIEEEKSTVDRIKELEAIDCINVFNDSGYIKVYKKDNVDELSTLYKKIIDEMKSRDNCKYHTNRINYCDKHESYLDTDSCQKCKDWQLKENK